MKLTEIDALRAYARMMNTLDISHIEPLLDDDFRYSSQWMIGEIPSKQEFLDYMKPWLLSIKQSGSLAYAEIAVIQAWGHNECVVTAEGEKDSLVATVFAHVKEEKIVRIDMCNTPMPSETMRTGEYPS
ncbi:MAG: nuclear transport factor 2 family protein [Gallionella sp.]|nr:nuclear transport factor 2 family protein [Gallionella sp.]